MAAQKIDRAEWQTFLDTMSKGLLGMRTEIEVASLAIGDQIEAEWLPLLGISYDPKDDVLEIALDGLDHLIYSPRELYADRRRRRVAEFRGDRRRWRLSRSSCCASR